MENEKMATISYCLSEKGQKASLLAGGDGKARQTITAPLTPELIEVGDVDRDGNIELSLISNPVVDISLSKFNPPNYSFTTKSYQFDTLQTPEALIKIAFSHHQFVEAKKLELAPELERRQTLYKEEAAIKEQQRLDKIELDRQANIAYQLRKGEEAAAIEKDRQEWIEAHGSKHLQKAVGLGYNSQRQYVIERADKDFFGFVVDFDNVAEWKTRSAPSWYALFLVEQLQEARVKAEVVWLTKPPIKDEDDYEWRPREAVVIRNWLGRYDLIKETEG